MHYVMSFVSERYCECKSAFVAHGLSAGFLCGRFDIMAGPPLELFIISVALSLYLPMVRFFFFMVF